MNHGNLIRGTFLGFKSSEHTNQETGETRMRHVMGIGVQRINEFGSTSEDIQKVSIRNDDFTNELINKMNEAKLKDVEIFVNYSPWNMNGKIGISVTFIPQYGISIIK